MGAYTDTASEKGHEIGHGMHYDHSSYSQATVTAYSHFRKSRGSEGIRPSRFTPPLEIEKGDVAWFTIIESLGRSPGAECFKARDLHLNRLVLLEVLEMAHPHTQARLDAARKVCGLNHPGVFTVYDLAVEGDHAYIAMEWVEGRSLKKWIPPNGLHPDRAIPMAALLAEGLAAVHENGMVHGALNPQVVRVYDDGVVKLTGFRFVDYLPTSGRLRVASANRDIDSQDDVRAFGRVFLFMLTGKWIQDEAARGEKLEFMEYAPFHCRSLLKACLRGETDMRQVTATIRDLGKESIGKKLFSSITWLVAVVLIGFFIWNYASKTAPKPPHTPVRLAVFPFANPGGDPQIDVFTNGLASSMSARLSHAGRDLDGFWVAPVDEISRMTFESGDRALDRLNLNLYFQGDMSWNRSGYRLRFQLWNAENDEVLSSETIDISPDALLESGNRVMEKAVDMLARARPGMSLSNLTPLKTEVSDAYRYYLQGEGYLYRAEEFDHLVLAGEAFQKALMSDPTLAPAYLGLGRVMLYHWDDSPDSAILDQARNFADQAERLNPHDPGIWLVRGLVYEKLGKQDQAIALFSRAMEVSPTGLHARLGLARALQDSGRLEEAEYHFKKAASDHPKDPFAAKHLGTFYYKLGRYEAAEHEFCRLITLAPNHFHGYRRLGVTLLRMNRFEESLAYLNQALALKPDEDFIYNNIGASYMNKNMPEAAIPYLEMAAAIAPENLSHLRKLAHALQLSSCCRDRAPAVWEHTLELAREALLTAPDQHEFRTRLALDLARSGHGDEALAELEKAPAHSGLPIIRAMVYEWAGRREEAIATIQDFLEHGSSLTALDIPDFADLKQDPRFVKMVRQIRPKEGLTLSLDPN